MRFAIFLICSALLSLPAADGEKYALLIGVNDYRPDSHLTPLKYAEADMIQLAGALVDSGFKPENIRLMIQGEVTDFRLKAQRKGGDQYKPRKSNIQHELDLLLKNRSYEDTVVVAVSGHGIQFRGKDEIYYCPSDAIADDTNTLLELNAVIASLKGCGAGAKLMIADCCRINPFEENLRAAFGDKVESATRMYKTQPPETVAVMFSCGKGEYAREEKEFGGGVFTHYLVSGLRGGAAQNGIVEIAGLASYTQYNVFEYVRKKYSASQTPEYKLNLAKPMILARGIKPPRESILPPAPEFAKTASVTPEAEETDAIDGDVRRYRCIAVLTQDGNMYGQVNKMETTHDLRYSWQVTGNERTLRFSSQETKISYLGNEMVHTFSTRQKLHNLGGTMRYEMPYAQQPPQQQEIMRDTFNTPLLRVQLDAAGKVIQRTELDRPGAKLVKDAGLIFGPSFFFLPYVPDQQQWETESEIYLRDGATAKGKLILKKIPGGNGGQLVQISGTFINNSFPAPNNAWTWKNGKFELSGTQTYDPSKREWVSGLMRTVGPCDAYVNGEKIGTMNNTMDVKFELLDGVVEAKAGVK